jgi:hypothetical protein
MLGHGWLGVDLFFLLSGFLITGLLFDTKDRPYYFKNFYIRRFLRIMPLCFTVVLIWSFVYRGYGRYFLLSSIFGANLSHLFGIHVPHGPGCALVPGGGGAFLSALAGHCVSARSSQNSIPLRRDFDRVSDFAWSLRCPGDESGSDLRSFVVPLRRLGHWCSHGNLGSIRML